MNVVAGGGLCDRAIAQAIIESTRAIDIDDARDMVRGATEKPHGCDPTMFLAGSRELGSVRVGAVPTSLFIANEAGDRYDGTVDGMRAAKYAARPSGTAPAVIASQGRRGGLLRIHDGGHRMSAARMRGDTSVLAIVLVRSNVASQEWTAKSVERIQGEQSGRGEREGSALSGVS